MTSEVFIIPGFKHSTKNSDYQKIGNIFASKGIRPVYIEIPWAKTTISQNVTFFMNEYRKSKADKKYVLGFSFGAVIAFLASAQVNFDAVFLCSLSPYFPEDLSSLKKSWISSIGKNRFNDFKSFDTYALTSKIKAKTFILFGAEEGVEIEKRAFETFSNLKGKKQLVKIVGVKHDIGNKTYQNEIKKLIENLA